MNIFTLNRYNNMNKATSKSVWAGSKPVLSIWAGFEPAPTSVFILFVGTGRDLSLHLYFGYRVIVGARRAVPANHPQSQNTTVGHASRLSIPGRFTNRPYKFFT